MQTLHRVITDDEIQKFRSKMTITHAEYLKIRDCPQRTPEWLGYRRNRVTGSNFGSAAGHNPYSTPIQLVTESLWREFVGNAACDWGTKYESTARDEYVAWLRSQAAMAGEIDPNGIWCDETGLMVVKSWPFAGISPDGIVHMGDGTLRLLEIKCPFKKRLYGPAIPSYYYDQVQGIMGLMLMNGLRLDGVDFVVWTPTQMNVQHFCYDAEYFDKHLFPALQRYYDRLYTPSAILFENNELQRGDTAFTNTIVCTEASTPPRYTGAKRPRDDGGGGGGGDNDFGGGSAVTVNDDVLAVFRMFQ